MGSEMCIRDRDKGSQIIVSADRAPNKLSRIQERIKSRFSGGLVVDIQKPDYELRKKIVASKTTELENLHSGEIKISDDLQELISLLKQLWFLPNLAFYYKFLKKKLFYLLHQLIL